MIDKFIKLYLLNDYLKLNKKKYYQSTLAGLELYAENLEKGLIDNNDE